MATRGNPRDFLILTNNPLVADCMDGRGRWTIRFLPEKSYREILVLARDMIYAGHILYTHPLAGSVKPGETPYKSLVVSVEPHGMEAEHALLIANAIEVHDKFQPIDWSDRPDALQDFQLIDYSLLSGAVGFDTEAGLSYKRSSQNF